MWTWSSHWRWRYGTGREGNVRMNRGADKAVMLALSSCAAGASVAEASEQARAFVSSWVHHPAHQSERQGHQLLVALGESPSAGVGPQLGRLDKAQMTRMDELERRVESLEHRLVTRDVLDGEIRSLERRRREVRELTES